MIAFCKDKQRRNLVLQTSGLNGLDYLEVLGMPGCGSQLALTFLKDARGLALAPANICLTGDTTLLVTGIESATSEDPLTITVQLNGTGDFSPYTITLVTSQTNNDPPPGIDPQLNTATFSFKAGCPTPVDCKQQQCCPSTLASPPDIHYLARDYDNFRQAMLDRIAVLLPTWTETHEADPGITLVEALAYAADRVSYLQDAVNTEAYIGTARSRISLRRHARLVDYQVSEGANARAWICMSVNLPNITVPAGTQFYPLVPGLAASIDPNEQVYAAEQLAASPGPVFESMEDITLYIEQNQMDFYTWGDGECCLPAGATQATLTGKFPVGAYSSLQAGQVLIFQEMLGPLTGNSVDADPTHRWAVRLTYASTTDNSGNPLVDPANSPTPPNPPVLLTNIAWDVADALPFPLCISSVTSEGLPISGVSVAFGNVVAADQGVWTTNESLGAVPIPPPPYTPMAGVGCNCSTTPGAAVPRPYFEPVLANQPLTFAVSYYPDVPASYSISAISRTGGVVTATLSATPTGVGSGPIIVGGVGDPSYDGQFTLTSVNGTTVTWSQGGADSVSAGGRLYVGTFNASIYDCAQQGLGTVPTGTPGIGLLGAQTGFALGGAITIAGNSVSGWNAKWPISATYAPVFMPPGTAGLPPGAPTTQGLTIVYLVTGTSVPSSIGNGGLAAAWPPASQMPSASSFLAPDTSTATPQITVFSDDGQIWLPTEDLLSKDSDYAGFIPEIEWDGTAHLRFGDGTYGEDPEPGVAFTAMYRTGNGASGNIGRDSLAHILMVGSAGITAVRNPLPAAGGVDPETMQHIVQVAPFAFQSQMRCVTAADYGTMAATLNGVSQAQGTIRWTGSWYSAFVSIDPATTWTNTLASQVETGLEMLRMMGTDLVVEEAVFVGLNIGLEICVSPNFFQGDVYQALWQLLVTGDSCTGTPGLLNAANFQFGQTVYASPIIAAAQSVTGVVAVTLVTFERMTQPTSAGTAPPTQLLMGSVEIPCCNNDPNHADLGFLTLTMDGGK